MIKPSIWVIVLNWNGWPDTLDCLASLASQSIPLHLMVVDNGSTDDSVERLKEFQILALPDNLGFAGGMNRGAEYALREGATHVLLLNNDTTLESDVVERLLTPLLEGRAEITVPRILSSGGPPDWYAGGSLSPWTGTVKHWSDGRGEVQVSFASGCCLFVGGETFSQLGGISEDYFLYFEDADFCWRARKAGKRILYVPDARIVHVGGKSTRSQHRKHPILDYYDVRNSLRFIGMLPLPCRITAWLYFLFVRIPRKLVRIVFLPRRVAAMQAVFWGVFDAWTGRWGPSPLKDGFDRG